ncbi:MAG TPA: saccharopine dehydrogenase NADP-binding domain-containing protein [Herpetosiphonaceae bacterium]
MSLVIYGATGFTGRLIVEEARARGLRPVLAGRRRAELEALAARWSPALEVRVAAPGDPASLAAMLDGAEVLLTTVGPFTDYGLPVAEAAARAGVHYLDTTGEQPFMADCRALFHDVMAARGKVMINAAAFEYTPGTLAAALLLAERGPVETLDVAYHMVGGGASRGTLKSILRLAGSPGVGFENGGFAPLGALERTLRLPLRPGAPPATLAQFPGGEVLAAPRLGRVRNVRSWIAVPEAAAMAGPFARLLMRFARDGLGYAALSALIDRLPAGPAEADRRAAVARVVLLLDGERADLPCPDPYGLTARIAVDLAERLLRGEQRASGVVSAAEAFEPGELLACYGLALERRR